MGITPLTPILILTTWGVFAVPGTLVLVCMSVLTIILILYTELAKKHKNRLFSTLLS